MIWKYGRENLIEEELMDTYVYTVFFSIIVSRFFYILLHPGEFGTKFLKYLVLREAPGLSLIGGLIGGAIFLFLYSRRRKLTFPKVADIFSLVLILGLSLASLGEFFGGGSYGKETKLPWGVHVVGVSGARHPVELYGSLLFFFLFLFLSFVYQKLLRRREEGTLSLIFLFCFAVVILVLEFFKEASVYLYNNISLNQAVAGVVLIGVFVPLIKRLRAIYKNSKNK